MVTPRDSNSEILVIPSSIPREVWPIVIVSQRFGKWNLPEKESLLRLGILLLGLLLPVEISLTLSFNRYNKIYNQNFLILDGEH